jgi:hypothetical protein
LFVNQLTAAGNQKHRPRVGTITQSLCHDGVEAFAHLLLMGPLRSSVAWRKRRCQQASDDEQQGDAAHSGEILSADAVRGAQETIPRHASPGAFCGALKNLSYHQPGIGMSKVSFKDVISGYREQEAFSL